MLETKNRPAEPDAPHLKSKNLERRLLSYAALPAALAVSAGGANAAFIGPYDVTNWSQAANGGDGSVDLSGAPGSVTLDGSDTGTAVPGTNYYIDFTISAVSNGFVSFNWVYTRSDVSAGYDFGSWLLNGTPTTLASDSASGSFSFAVTAGDVFGFRVLTDDDQLGRGYLTISNFNAPEASSVPEPTTLSLLALGSVGLLAARRRKKQS